MSARKTKPEQRQIIAYGVGDFEVGGRFEKWPHHVTLATWFREADQKRLHEQLQDVVDRRRPIHAVVGGVVDFGPERDIPVREVVSSHVHPLHLLHCGVISAVYRSGGQFEDERYISYKYRPHITLNGLAPDKLPNVVLVDSFALITANGPQKEVSEVYEFNG